MNIFELVTCPETKKLICYTVSTGGIIYGGFVRDMVAGKGKPGRYKDIDIFYHKDNPNFNISLFSVGLKPKLKSFWYDKYSLRTYRSNVDSYLVHTGTNQKEFKLNFVKNFNHSEDILPTANLDFLDFDINTLYLGKKGEILCTLGPPEPIISNIYNKQCSIINKNISRNRLYKFTREKGYKIVNL